MYLGVRTGLIAVQPHADVTLAVVLHLASVRALTPSAVVLGSQGQAHSAIVGHVPAPVYHQMYVVRIVQRFRAAPYHGERHGDVGGAGRVRELGLLAVNRVREQPSVHDRHTALYVELADETGLHDELLQGSFRVRFRASIISPFFVAYDLLLPTPMMCTLTRITFFTPEDTKISWESVAFNVGQNAGPLL